MADDLTLEIDASELGELIRQFPEYQDIVLKKLVKATTGSLFKFQELIQGKTPTGVSGDLKKDFKVSIPIVKENSITGEVTSSLPYAFPIELGRKPGKKISRTGKESIELWIRRTWGEDVPPEKKIKGVVFVVARSISKKGFKKKKGYRMVEQAFEEGTPQANKLFDLATQEAVKEIERKIDQIE